MTKEISGIRLSRYPFYTNFSEFFENQEVFSVLSMAGVGIPSCNSISETRPLDDWLRRYLYLQAIFRPHIPT